MTAMAECVWIWWSPGEPEDDLHGFVTREDRDACGRGEARPFKRVVRDPGRGQIPHETLIVRRYLDQQYPFGNADIGKERDDDPKDMAALGVSFDRVRA